MRKSCHRNGPGSGESQDTGRVFNLESMASRLPQRALPPYKRRQVIHTRVSPCQRSFYT